LKNGQPSTVQKYQGKSVDHNFNGSNEQTGGYEPNMYIVDTSGVLLIENNCNETTKLTNVALTSSSPQNLYICETCGTLFKQKWQLNKHMVTHGELPYICKLCQTKYKTSVAHVLQMCGFSPK
jgi:DNA-directed RNA polymerase subunit RPC12/RpoP